MPVDATRKVIADGADGHNSDNHDNLHSTNTYTGDLGSRINPAGEHINNDTTGSATGSAKDAMKHPISGAAKVVGDTLGTAAGMLLARLFHRMSCHT